MQKDTSQNSTDINPQTYAQSRIKGLAIIGVGIVGGWFAGLALNKVFRQNKGISAERIEQFGGPFKSHLQSLQQDDVLLYETVGSVVGGAGAAIYRGYGGWKRTREQSADLSDIKQMVNLNHNQLRQINSPENQIVSGDASSELLEQKRAVKTTL